MEANPFTLVTEASADFFGLWQPEEGRYRDVRQLFVPQTAITTPIEVEYNIGGGETETRLEYEEPTDDQIPSLKSLLDYLEERPGGQIVKNFYIRRKHLDIREGDVHLFSRHKHVRVKRQQSIEAHATHLTQKKISQTRIYKNALETNQHFSFVKKTHRRHVTSIEAPVHFVYQKKTKNIRNIRPIIIIQN